MSTITSPQIVADMDDATYHADPVKGGSLSSTMIRKILRSPAHLRAYMQTPRTEKAAWDFGHVVHAGVLGVGMGVVVLDYDDWRLKVAREERDAIYADGKVPMLERDYAPAAAAIEAVRSHAIAGPLFAGDGHPERSVFGVDPETGAWLRTRPDWETPSGVLVDLKTTTDASGDRPARHAVEYGWDSQAALYLHNHEIVTGRRPRAFVHVLVEKDAPHLVRVVQLDVEALRVGAEKMRRGIDLWTQARETGHWRGYPDDQIETIALPAWHVRQHEEENL